jgi:Transglutaminase-like superfamily
MTLFGTEAPVQLTWHRHVTARCAVAVARLLTPLPPRQLRQLLRLLSRGTRPATPAEALRARQAVVTVSPRCAGAEGCLQRSLATVLLCRLRGRWADWCTGIRSRPFRAHAWVEADGGAVGEPGDMSLYRTMLSVRHPEGAKR